MDSIDSYPIVILRYNAPLVDIQQKDGDGNLAWKLERVDRLFQIDLEIFAIRAPINMISVR